MKTLTLIIILLSTLLANSQTYPSYGPEIDVTIAGLTFDAMEPFISPDGNTLFFNNLNSGDSTKLFYATKVNDSTFNYVGELNGTNQVTPPYLDGVPDMDSSNNFYWTSTRNYGAELETLFHGNYSSGNVTNIGRVHGNFNKNIPGWLIMDHGISYNGNSLVFCNARFETNQCQGGACETEMGIAQKVNDSTFNKVINSTALLQNINDTNFIYYAPCLSSDELELYYTRYARDSVTLSTSFEICVAVRNLATAAFSVPIVLFSETFIDLIEAPTLTTDKQIMYYHRKIPGSHRIVMRYRENPLTINHPNETYVNFRIYPNPANNLINTKILTDYNNINISVLSLFGELLIFQKDKTQININTLPSGTYFVRIEIDNKIEFQKFVIVK